MKKYILSSAVAVMMGTTAFAQDGTTTETFHSFFAVNSQTVMHPGKKTLSYRISHRLGDFDSGVMNGFGLDGPASVLIGFDYGVTDKLTLSLNRNSLGKLVEGGVKYNIFNQSSSMPLTLGVYGKANLTYAKDEAAAVNGFDRYGKFAHRFTYISQILIARKFGSRLSLQLSPTYIHHNLVETEQHSNDVFSLGAIAEFKCTKKLSVVGEYNYVLNNPWPETPADLYKHSAGLGLNIVTGGHVFQIVLVNSFAVNDAMAISSTTEDWLDGKFRIGFNIMRSFWL